MRKWKRETKKPYGDRQHSARILFRRDNTYYLGLCSIRAPVGGRPSHFDRCDASGQIKLPAVGLARTFSLSVFNLLLTQMQIKFTQINASAEHLSGRAVRAIIFK